MANSHIVGGTGFPGFINETNTQDTITPFGYLDIDSGAVGITGSVAWTEPQDLWAGAGTVTFPTITGIAAWTEPQDLWNGTGTITAPAITGSVAWVEPQDAWAGTGTVALPAITGTVAWTEPQDRWSSIGGPVIFLLDDGHDPGIRKRKRKKYDEDRDARDARRATVIDAFERVIEGKEIAAPAVDEVVQEVLREIDRAPIDTGDFEKRLDAAVDNAYRAYLERDDEEVLALL